MAKDHSLVRASDIGAWTYCHRAWWLTNIKGVPHRDPALLRRGEAMHARHGRQVLWSRRLRRVGYLLIGVGLALAAGLVLFWLWMNP